jgi:acyl phosphate:glycerol-3-phosphate acyltransferase
MLIIFTGVLVAYLIGSIPTAVWYGRIFHGIDIRQHGSGNSGATNSLRIMGKRAGIFVLLIDVLKGFLAIKFASILSQNTDNQPVELISVLLGGAVVVGHIFPVFAQFKGGKGVATALGVILAVNPLMALGSIILFILIVFLTRYVSLGSMLGGLSFPILMLIFQNKNPIYIYFGFGLAILLMITHRENIKKLLSGTENKFNSNKK